MAMNDEQLERYSRQILLPNIGIEGQQRLLEAEVLIVGAGGLGSPVAMYLAAAGVGKLVLADGDRVDLSNLQRQIAHTTSRIGNPKADSATTTLKAINNQPEYVAINTRLEGAMLEEAVYKADVVVDCTDNFNARFAINRACVQHKTPLVSGAVIRMEGQVGVFDLRGSDSPCYQCLYKPENGDVDTSCTSNGVLAPVVGIVGSLQATETIKLLTGLPTLAGHWLVIDALYSDFRKMKLPKDASCPVCGSL